jgi:hypothetical protein
MLLQEWRIWKEKRNARQGMHNELEYTAHTREKISKWISGRCSASAQMIVHSAMASLSPDSPFAVRRSSA